MNPEDRHGGPRTRRLRWRVLGALLGVLMAPVLVFAEGDVKAQADTDSRIQALEEQVRTLAAELSRAVTGAAVPEDGDWENYYGVGPAASKVYAQDKGLSIGGYGELLFQHNSDADDTFDTYRAVLYVGYKFSDKWVLNSEFEFEHAGGSDVYVEFLNLDYQHSKELNFRLGLILLPMGFLNQIHEPTFYYGGSRPEVEKYLIPTTWRENGGGVYGRIGERVSYQAYALTSLKGENFNGSGFRGGRQKGIKALANNWSVVARADVDLISGLMVGGSVYTGHQGQDQGVGSLQTTLYELHAQYQRYGVHLRGLLAQAFVDNPDSLNQSPDFDAKEGYLAETSLGWYLEAAYDVLSVLMPNSRATLEPFIRYQRLNTQDEFQSATYGTTGAGAKWDREIITAGLQFKPIPQIVLKLDYRYTQQARTGEALAKQVEFGAGYVF